MTNATTPAPAKSVLESARARRYDFVRSRGKAALRAFTAFLGRQSLVPDAPILERGTFAFESELESKWEAVRGELESLLDRRHELPMMHDIEPGQNIGSEKWRTFWLWGFGTRADKNCERCPETASLLEQVPGLRTAIFSIMEPGTVVPPHKGVTKGVLRGHLGLLVPKDRERCRMQLGETGFSWEPGRLVIFDDTERHSVQNDTEEMRAVLLFDFDRPMRPLGRLAHRVMLAALRHSVVFATGAENQKAWELAYYGLDDA